MSSTLQSALLSTLAATAVVSAAHAATVEITGGFDPKSSEFRWKIKNRGNSPINYLEFPHYHADALVAPTGWTEKSTNLVGAEVPAEPGVCTAKAELLVDAISPGEQKTFIMRLSRAGGQIGKGTVLVRFTNGQEEKVSGVELPVKAQQGFGLLPGIALAVAFGLYVFLRYLRGRAAPAGNAPPGPREEVI